MSQANLEQFQHLVLRDTALQGRLRATSDRDEFLALVLRLSAERGCPLGAEEVRSALQSPRHDNLPGSPANAAQLAGWIPIRIYWQQSRPVVEWCYVGRLGFTEPFFEQTISICLRHPFNRLFYHRTPIDTLADLYAVRPGLLPSGFVFHMSRCGSTLIAQMLAALPQALVIAEAEPIDAVLRAHFQDAHVTDDQRVSWLRWTIGALGQPQDETTKHYLVKFDSWNVIDLALIQRAFPTVPWIFVYRDPVEVLVSHGKQPGSQMVPGALEPELLNLDGAHINCMALEEYHARVLERICHAAVRHYQRSASMLVNYRQLPEIVWSVLLDFFHVSYTAADIERMRHITQFDAKNPALYFSDDTSAKQAVANDRLRQRARQWLEQVYTQLETLRLADGDEQKYRAVEKKKRPHS